VRVHVCDSDGQAIGEYEERDFRENVFAGRLPADSHYWHEGMEDWRPIADYRALAKTQRISFAPPVRRTIKIQMEPSMADPSGPPSKGSLGRWWRRLTGKKK